MGDSLCSTSAGLGYNFVLLFGKLGSPVTFAKTVAFKLWFVEFWEFSCKSSQPAKCKPGKAIFGEVRLRESLAAFPGVGWGVCVRSPHASPASGCEAITFTLQVEHTARAARTCWEPVPPSRENKSQSSCERCQLVALGGGCCPQQLP